MMDIKKRLKEGKSVPCGLSKEKHFDGGDALCPEITRLLEARAKNKLDRKKLNFELTWSHRRRRRDAASRRRDAASMASTRPRVDSVETSRCDVVGAVAREPH